MEISDVKKKVLITGVNGMLGSTLAHLFQEKFEVFATGTKKNSFGFLKNYLSFDLKRDSYEELVAWSDPDVIIHCAALTSGNHCENHPHEAIKVNGLTLYKFTRSIQKETKIIYISTDAVFSSDTHMASEKDCPNPQSIYGKTKELGEFFLLNSEVDFSIVRTTIVGLNLDSSRVGFVEWIINSAKGNEEISLFDDVLFNPIAIWDLAEQLGCILNSGSAYSRKILHIAGKEPISKYQFGIELLRKLNLPVEQVRKGSIKDMPDRAKRSTDQSLNCSYYEYLAKIELPNLEKTIGAIKENLEHYEKN